MIICVRGPSRRLHTCPLSLVSGSLARSSDRRWMCSMATAAHGKAILARATKAVHRSATPAALQRRPTAQAVSEVIASAACR